ncbi:unnamed protein product [Dicrocoelium dendriticum]|nr:unnamed protein product [Dicrocoelium dendriticum]
MASTLRLASFGQSATEDVSSDKVGRKGKSNFVSFKPEPLLDEMQHQLEAAIGGAECSSERFASTSKQTMQLSTHLTNDPMSSGEKDVKVILTENRELQSLNDSCKRDLSRSNLNHRGLMKCSQKSSSFAVGESHKCRSSSPGATQINRPYNSPASSNRTTYRSSRDLRSESNKVISRRRVPLSNRIKSFSVDDKQDLDIDASTCRSTLYPDEENSCKFSSRRSVPSVSPNQMHPWRAGKELEEHNIRQSEQTQTRVKLSSTKSFSLDAPVTVISDDSGQLISGASSPGQIGLIACVNSRAQIPLRSTSGKHFMSTSARNLDTCVRFVPHAAHHVYDRRKPASVYPFFIDSAPMVTKDRCVTLYGRSTFADEMSRPHYQPTQRGTELNPNYLPGRPFLAPGCTKRAEMDIQKAQAEAPTIYYVIKEYIPRLNDELQLHSNRMVNVLESSDPIWWFGICEGRSGYFPSSHVRKLEGEKTNLQL